MGVENRMSLLSLFLSFSVIYIYIFFWCVGCYVSEKGKKKLKKKRKNGNYHVSFFLH